MYTYMMDIEGYVRIHVYIYMHICIYMYSTYTHIYIYIYICRTRTANTTGNDARHRQGAHPQRCIPGRRCGGDAREGGFHQTVPLGELGHPGGSRSLSLSLYIYIYVYTHTYIYTYVCTYM